MKLNYKFIKYIFPTVALALSSCIYDSYDDGTLGGGSSDEDGDKFYVSFRINEVGLADDDSLEDGEDYEHAIAPNGNNVFFFDEAGTLLSMVELKKENKEDPDDGDNIEATYYTAVINLKNQTVPSSCIVVLNGNKIYKDIVPGKVPDPNVTVGGVLGKIWSDYNNPASIGIDGYNDEGKPYFTMTNSTYFKDGQLQQAVPIEAINLVPEDELDQLPARAVKVYVERMVSKVSFAYDGVNATQPKQFVPEDPKMILFTGFNETGTPQYDTDKSWRVNVVGWGMNGLETKSHIFKNVNPSGNYFSGWSDPANFRTYWSEDPHYEGTYPEQYREAVDNPSLNYYKKMEENGLNQLRNYSYNDLLQRNNLGYVAYLPENTYDADGLRSGLGTRTDLLAGSHIVILAELLSNIDDGNSYTARDVYRDRNNIFYKTEKECFQAKMMELYNTVNSQREMRFRYFCWDENKQNELGEVLIAKTAQTAVGKKYQLWWNGKPFDYEALKSYSPSEYSRPARLTNGDGQRLMWIEGLDIRIDNNTPLKIYNSKGEYLRDATDNDIKSICLEWNGPIDHFKDGKMYYAAPPLITTVNGKDYFGTVRNAWYQFSLVRIKRVGTSVDDDTQEIVPIKVQVEDQLDFSTIMLDWHIIENKLTGVI